MPGKGEAAPQHEPHSCGQTLAISANWIFTYPINLSIQQNEINEKGPLVMLQEIKIDG